MLATETRAAVQELGLELFAPNSSRLLGHVRACAEGMDSGVIVKEFCNRFGAIIANGRLHEGSDLSHRTLG